jgi:hypothetical protein
LRAFPRGFCMSRLALDLAELEFMRAVPRNRRQLNQLAVIVDDNAR